MNILLTGDDGYNSIGTRILINLLSKEHTLTVVGVKTQQSGVGGKVSLQKGGEWKETSIDENQAFWVDGTPADAMEFAHSKIKDSFDLILSGINLGENITSAIISSGTVSAAIRGLGLGVAPRAIAISWETPPEYYFLPHDEREDITDYLVHPGENARKVLDICFQKKCFGAELLNINIPRKKASKIFLTRQYKDSSDLYPPIVVRDDGTYAYPPEVSEPENISTEYDLGALKTGNISLSPLTIDWTNTKVFENIKKKEILL
jgi:5'-nucleotidase